MHHHPDDQPELFSPPPALSLRDYFVAVRTSLRESGMVRRTFLEADELRVELVTPTGPVAAWVGTNGWRVTGEWVGRPTHGETFVRTTTPAGTVAVAVLVAASKLVRPRGR